MLPTRWSRIRRPLVVLVSTAVVLPVLVLPVLGLPAAGADDEVTTGDTLVGEFVQMVQEFEDDDEAAARADEGVLSFVRTEDGESVRVDTDDVQEIEVGATVELTVGRPVADEATEDGYAPAREVLAAEVVAAAPAAPAGPRPTAAASFTNPEHEVTVVMVNPDGGVQDGTTLQEVVDAVNGPVADFWWEQGRESVGVVAAHDWMDTVADCSDPDALWDEVAEEVGFVPTIGAKLLLYVTSAPADLACSYGLATLASNKWQTGYAYVRDTSTSLIAHELGHTFTLGHSSARQCDGTVETGSCQVVPYADYYDVMGFSWDQVGSLNLVHSRAFNVLQAWHKTSIYSTSPAQTVTLAPVSNLSALRGIELWGGPGKVYWLEYRPAAGRDAWLATGDNPGLQTGVFLRQETGSRDDASLLLDGTPSTASRWDDDFHSALPVGTPFRLAGGDFTVTVQSLSPSAAQIRVSSAGTATPLVKSADNPAVYLVSSTGKHLVADLATLEAFSPLGRVKVVSQQLLDSWPTQARMGRVATSPDGAIYFLDAGIRLPLSSCAQVAEFGASCDSLVMLEQPLINKFHGGPSMTQLYRTTSGKAFYVSGGTKREVVDDAALAAASLPTTGVRLLESGIGYLPYGAPITRDGVALLNRSTGAVSISSGGGVTTVPEPLRAATPLRTLPMRALDDASIRRLPTTSVPGPVVKESGGPRIFLLTETGRRELTDPAMAPVSPPEVSAAFLALFPDAGPFAGAGFFKGSATNAVYVLQKGERRVVSSWPDLLALNNGSASPAILTIDQRLASLVPLGRAQLGPGSLVHSPRSAAVFFVNGRAELIPLGSFNTTNELGSWRVVRVADADVDAYTVRSTGISTALDCGGQQYLGLGGRLYTVGSDVVTDYALAYTTVDPSTCAGLPKASRPLTRFLRASSGAIYYIEAGTKRPIRSYTGYLALGGTVNTTIQVSDFALSRIRTGAAH